MKNVFTKLTALSLLIICIGCSSDNSSDNSNTGINENNFKPLKSVILESPQFDNTSVYFDYENDFLQKMAIEANRTSYMLFSYNEINKISTMTVYLDTNNDNTQEIDFDNELNFNGETYQVNHYYKNGNLVKLDFSDEGRSDILYEYDKEGRVNKVSCPDAGHSCEVVTFFYTDDKISSYSVGYGGEAYIVNTEFDDKINPINKMFRTYGIVMPWWGGSFFDDYRAQPYSKNNLENRYVKGESTYFATYEYDADGYPVHITYNEPSTGNSGVVFINYQ